MSTTADAKHNAEKAQCPLKSLVNNMQSTGLWFKSWVFFGVHWALHSGCKGLTGNLQGPNTFHYSSYRQRQAPILPSRLNSHKQRFQTATAKCLSGIFLVFLTDYTNTMWHKLWWKGHWKCSGQYTTLHKVTNQIDGSVHEVTRYTMIYGIKLQTRTKNTSSAINTAPSYNESVCFIKVPTVSF